MPLFLSILGLLAILPLAGAVYQWIGAHRDRRRFTSEGRWIGIDPKTQLYLLEKGSGTPTVLFESGIAATNLNWRQIQRAVSQFTHTASYDRAGLGWSSRATTARTPANIAVELHVMLKRAEIPAPYILVGHSFGGLVMRRFATLYPQEVRGVVLLDPMRCEDWPPFNPAQQPTLDRGMRMAGYAIPAARLGLARFAVTSLLGRSGRVSNVIAGIAGSGGRQVLSRIKQEVGKMPRAVWPMVAAHWSHPSYYIGMRSHIQAVPATVSEMQSAEPIHKIPVMLLTPGKSVPQNEQEIRQIGDNVEQIIATVSAHWVHLDQPDLVVESIRQMVESVLAVGPEPVIRQP